MIHPERLNLDHHLGYLMRRVSNRVSDNFASALLARGITVSEWVCLVQIHNQPRITPSNLAESIGMTQGAVSKINDKLSARGWIMSEGNEADRRGQFLSLTELGREVLPEFWSMANANEELHFASLPSEDREALRRILTQLSESNNWEEIPTK